MASLPRLGKVFRETHGLQVIDSNTCSLHCICRDFTVIALCFERGLYQWPGKEGGGGGVQWYNRGEIVPIFHEQTEVGERLTAGVKVCTYHGLLHKRTTKKSKASLYVRKSSGKNVTVSGLWYNLIIFISGKPAPRRNNAPARSTVPCDQGRKDRTNNNLWLHAFQVKDKQHFCSNLEVKDEQTGWCSRSTLEIKEEQIAIRLNWGGMRPQNGIKRDMNRKPRLTRSISITFVVEDSRIELKSSEGQTI